MQGLAAITDRSSLTYLAFRNQSPYLKRYAKPTRVYLSNFGTFPKLSLSVSSSSQRQIVPIVAKSNQLFAHGLPPLGSGSRINRRLRTKSATVRAYSAYKDDSFSRTVRLRKTEERPEWFWMMMACVPYLITLKMSEIGFFMKPFLQQHGGAIGETIINLIPGPVNKLQYKLYVMYCVLGSAWIVKDRNLPHYFRFHMNMGMLLQIAMEIIWNTSEFFPLINHRGRLATHYHMVLGFSYTCLLLECLRCAMSGAYPQIPVITNAAYSNI